MHYSYRSLFSLLLAVAVSAGVMGCDTLTEGNNVDPNQAQTAETALILNSAQVASALYNEGNHARIAAIWSSHLTGADRQYLSAEGYSAVASDFDNMWITGYADVIGDLQEVKRKTRGTNPLILGIAQTMEAYTYGMKTALHGSIPLEEASQGEGNLNPKFDDQSAVYQSVIDTLNAAISNFQAGGISPGDKDIYYGGDDDKWLELANTLKARFLLHMNRPGDALSAANNGISTPDNNMVTRHGNARGVDSNPFYVFDEIERASYLNANTSHAASLIDSSASNYRGNAKTDESARFSHYFTGGPGAWDLNTNPGAYFGQATDYALVTYAENELIKAEAVLLSSSSPPSNSDMQAAITALNNARDAADQKFPGQDYYQPYTMNDFQSGNMANPQGESQGNAILREILEEKYVTLMAHLEAFNDLRRTDNFLEIPPKSGSELPQRFLIAQTEINANDNAPDNPPGLFEPTPVNANIDYTGL